jgi:hypothetical protein
MSYYRLQADDVGHKGEKTFTAEDAEGAEEKPFGKNHEHGMLGAITDYLAPIKVFGLISVHPLIIDLP